MIKGCSIARTITNNLLIKSKFLKKRWPETLFQEVFGLKEKKFLVSDDWTRPQSDKSSFSVFDDKIVSGSGWDKTERDLFTRMLAEVEGIRNMKLDEIEKPFDDKINNKKNISYLGKRKDI